MIYIQMYSIDAHQMIGRKGFPSQRLFPIRLCIEAWILFRVVERCTIGYRVLHMIDGG